MAGRAIAPSLIVVDFDGTITEHDTLVEIVQAHAPDVFWQLEDDLDAGRITLRECIEREFAAVRGEHDQIVAEALAGRGCAAGSPSSRQPPRAGDHRLVVVSSGFESIIRPVLEQAGVVGVEVVAHEVRFSPRRHRPSNSATARTARSAARSASARSFARWTAAVAMSSTSATASPTAAARWRPTACSRGANWRAT